jgi:hypothetical protein
MNNFLTCRSEIFVLTLNMKKAVALKERRIVFCLVKKNLSWGEKYSNREQLLLPHTKNIDMPRKKDSEEQHLCPLKDISEKEKRTPPPPPPSNKE